MIYDQTGKQCFETRNVDLGGRNGLVRVQITRYHLGPSTLEASKYRFRSAQVRCLEAPTSESLCNTGGVR